MFQKLFLGFALAVSVVACGPQAKKMASGQNEAVIGGRPDQLAEGFWKFTAKLNVMSALCTGALISDTVVLTAAHCMVGEYATATFDDLNGHRETIPVTKSNCGISAEEISRNSEMEGWKYVSPERADEMKIWDICALKLQRRPGSQFVPVKIFHGLPSAKEGLIHVGYGQSYDHGGSGTRLVGTSQFVRATKFTAESNQSLTGTHICFGDSGGPVIVRQGRELFLLGVLSAAFGDELCSKSYAVQTKLAEPFADLWKNL